MTENKRFVKYDGNTIVDLKLVKSWIISNGNVELLLEILNNEKTSKKGICIIDFEDNKMTEDNRFVETISTGIVTDTVTGKEYDCEMRINDNLLNLMNNIAQENEELKKVLGSILREVKRDISNTNQTGEITVVINPNSFNLISEVLRKYGALKEWYG